MKVKILCWNIQGTKYVTHTDISKIIPRLRRIRADVLCIQEGQELSSKLKEINKDKYSYVFSSENKDGSNLIISKFPILNHKEFDVNNIYNNFIGKVLCADIYVKNSIVRIYNCHFEIDNIGPSDRLQALEVIIKDSKLKKFPTIICGDLNTTIPKIGIGRRIVQLFHNENLSYSNYDNDVDERYAFNRVARENGFIDAWNIKQTTWCIDFFKIELFKLKLDWFFMKGVKKIRIKIGKFISDHKSIIVVCKI